MWVAICLEINQTKQDQMHSELAWPCRNLKGGKKRQNSYKSGPKPWILLVTENVKNNTKNE
jgi:hypothetical protein